MDLLETQANDLRFLTQARVPAANSATGRAPQHTGSAHGDNSAHSTASLSPGNRAGLGGGGGGGGGGGAKRKADNDDAGSGGKQQRSKRNRYISIACNECKRRKIKCNGETPCQRCGNLNLACLYTTNCCSTNFKDSDEFKAMTEHMERLQDQVDNLYRDMSALRADTLRLAPIQNPVLPLPNPAISPSPAPSTTSSTTRPELFQPKPPSFRGPTSHAFTVDVAKNTLHKMGYVGERQDDGVPVPEDIPVPSPLMQPSTRSTTSGNAAADPLCEFDKDEMIRLCRVHDEEVGIMYPVVKIDTIIVHARILASFLNLTKKNGTVGHYDMESGDPALDMKTLQLKIVMCCALVVEGHGYSEKASRLFENVRPTAERMLMTDDADVANLPFLALVAGYKFLANEEVLSWRIMGQVARLCLELGLHRRDAIAKIADEQDRTNALNTFWSAYVLDKRWSFGTGLPYVVQDDKIDPGLPYPTSHPFLVAMISYSKLGAKIWKLVDYFEPCLLRELKREDFEALDREILEWYDTVPDEVKLSRLNKEMPLPSAPSYNLQRLQIWTRLRLNQVRIWLLTPILHSASSIQSNYPLAERVVELARDTIQYLTRLNEKTNLYRRIQVFYHQFLTSAIAVLFLASTHAPVHFSAKCRDEFFVALDLVKDMSARSWVSQRLWKTVKSLKAYAPRLGLEQRRGDGADDPAGAAALVMAGLASGLHGNGGGGGSGSGGHTHSPLMAGGASKHSAPPAAAAAVTAVAADADPELENGVRLQTEMSRIFETYTGLGGAREGGADGGGGGMASHGFGTPTGEGAVIPGSVQSDGVYQQFKALF